MRYQDIAAICSCLLSSGPSPASVNSTFSALKQVAKEARRSAFMTSGEHELIEDVERARGSRSLASRKVAREEAAHDQEMPREPLACWEAGNCSDPRALWRARQHSSLQRQAAPSAGIALAYDSRGGWCRLLSL